MITVGLAYAGVTLRKTPAIANAIGVRWNTVERLSSFFRVFRLQLAELDVKEPVVIIHSL